MSERESPELIPPALIDRSVKAMIRSVPDAFCRLARVDADPHAIRFEDVALNLAEFRADHVLIIGTQEDPSCWAMHLEYQLEPDLSVMPGWLLKYAALTIRLGVRVILVAVYLTRGDYATFPDTFAVRAGGLDNAFSFHTIRLWEHADRIRSGELAELAPLLVLCEDKPSERTLRQERRLIMQADVAAPVRAELLAVALTVGLRHFGRDVLEKLFRKELDMLKGASIIEGWMEEREAQCARSMLLRLLRERFGELPEDVVARVESEGREWCEAMIGPALSVDSLGELDV
jgi:hypothetical protein